MIRGLYIANTGMNVQAKRMDIISNDLANVNTNGYKKDTAVVESFPEVMARRINDIQNNYSNEANIGTISFGARVADIRTDYIQGSLISTGGKTDLAIQGDGFFEVGTTTGNMYTRDGKFVINGDGRLVTQEGYGVMGEAGAIDFGSDYIATGGEISISQSGEISLNGEIVDTIRVVKFADNQNLEKASNNLYTSTAQPSEIGGSLIQGFVESSNVNPVTAMVDMITVSRAYEANQKVMQVHDNLLGKAVNEVGRG